MSRNVHDKKPLCQTLLKNFSKSRKMVTVRSFLLKYIANSSLSLVIWMIVEWLDWKVNCSDLMRWAVAILSLVRVSYTLAMVILGDNLPGFFLSFFCVWVLL